MSDWLIEALTGTSLLMMFVGAMRRPVARLFGAQAAYALWLLPALRMVMPALPGWTPLYVPAAGTTPAGGVTLALVEPAVAATVTPLPAPEPGLVADWPALLLALWAAGAVTWFGWQMLRYRLFLYRALKDSELLTREAGVDVIISAHVDGPMAAGIFKRRIFLPADFLTRYTPAERRAALLHEGAHHDRRDLWANFVGLAVVAAHWWNPVAHIAWRAFRADQEQACDATVLARASGDDRFAYGSAVLKSACVRTPAAACAMNHKSQLKERLTMMKARRFGTLRSLMGTAAVGVALVGGLLATASGAQPAPPEPPAPMAPTAPTAPATPPLPPTAPQPPEAPKVMVLKTVKKDGKDGKPQVTTVRIDGDKVSTSSVDGDADLQTEIDRALAEAGKASSAAAAAATEAGQRRIVMIRHMDAGHEAAARIAAHKAELAAKCAAKGAKVSPDAGFGELAMCGDDFQARMRASLARARESIQNSRDLSDAQRTAALQGIDKAMRDMPAAGKN